MSNFPSLRARRLRLNTTIRDLVRETAVTAEDLIQGVFVVPGQGVEEPLKTMPGVCRYSLDRLPAYIARLVALGVRGLIFFGVPESKDEEASGAYASDGIVQEALRIARQTAPEMLLVADVCLCEYMSHGHCGVLCGENVDNDRTLPLLAQTAVSLADAGADWLAPSAMMDGQVLAIRQALDAAGYQDRAILAYSAKFASSFYGPFREAAESAPAFGDRKAYQMDPANAREALKEVELDLAEGADLVMVKPAMPYLDVLSKVRAMTHVPVVAYQVSGEYAMLRLAIEAGALNKRAMDEALLSIKRAGADLIITYAAEDVLRRQALAAEANLRQRIARVQQERAVAADVLTPEV